MTSDADAGTAMTTAASTTRIVSDDPLESLTDPETQPGSSGFDGTTAMPDSRTTTERRVPNAVGLPSRDVSVHRHGTASARKALFMAARDYRDNLVRSIHEEPLWPNAGAARWDVSLSPFGTHISSWHRDWSEDGDWWNQGQDRARSGSSNHVGSWFPDFLTKGTHAAEYDRKYH
jgi:hypothetical protein